MTFSFDTDTLSLPGKQLKVSSNEKIESVIKISTPTRQKSDYSNVEKDKIPVLLKRLEKKLNQIAALKKMQEQGKELTLLQKEKMATETLLKDEVADLKARLVNNEAPTSTGM